MQESTTGAEIAIVAMHCRVPGADDIDAFWANLRAATESIRALTDDELAGVVPPALRRDPAYVAAASVIEGEDLFDAEFFGYSPREAALIDPQQRLFLEGALVLLDRAGCDPRRTAGRVGVFAAASANTYAISNLWPNRRLRAEVDDFELVLAGDKDFVATRTAYKLDLHGPAVTVQTACSSSLVAVHLACQSLLAGDSDLAIAGGVTVRVPQRVGHLAYEAGIASPDGHCRTFDADAAGTINGNGLALVALKRWQDAVADGDSIHAVIKASAVNNDGARKVGFTAPSVQGQAAAIRSALELAGVDPQSVGLIEAHGTATALGDPIEVAALTEAFGGATDAPWCAIGSVKSNVGHLDTAAGVLGLIKATLAVQYGEIPPTLHYRRPNPNIDFRHSPFVVSDTLRPWPSASSPRRAGVSSFGMGGTNAHVVIEQAPPRTRTSTGGDQVLPVSARDSTALRTALDRLADYLDRHPELALADVAGTLQVGRTEYDARHAIVASTAAEATEKLRLPVRSASLVNGRPPLAWLFPGQGSQFAGMAAEHYDQQVFRETFDQCAALVRDEVGWDLREVVFGTAGDLLTSTKYTQPALFAVEYALGCLWLSRGVTPDALAGHSIGEYAAACLAGVFEVQDAVRLVARRGELMESMGRGAMLGVPLDEHTVSGHLIGDVVVAAINAPAMVTLAGPVPDIEATATALRAAGIQTRRLRVERAFHSPMADGVLDRFAEVVSGCSLKPPSRPVLSNVTGTWLTDDEATDPAYWVRQLRSPVRFAGNVAALLSAGHRLFLEVGPGSSLSGLVRQQAGEDVVTVPSLPLDERAGRSFLGAVGSLWVHGVRPDWRTLATSEPRRVVLPAYPLRPVRHWVDAPEPAAAQGLLQARSWISTDRLRAYAVPAAAYAVVAADPQDATAAELSRLISTSAQSEVYLCPPDLAAAAEFVQQVPADRPCVVVTKGLLAPESQDELWPGAAELRTALASLPACRIIDLSPRECQPAAIAAAIAAEISADFPDGDVALRGRRRWVRRSHDYATEDQAWTVVAEGTDRASYAQSLKHALGHSATVGWSDPSVDDRSSTGVRLGWLVTDRARWTEIQPMIAQLAGAASEVTLVTPAGSSSGLRMAELTAAALETAGLDEVTVLVFAVGASLDFDVRQATAGDDDCAHPEPTTDSERYLAEVWRDLLGVQRVGLDDDFYRLGGHSLLVTRLVSRIKADTGVELTVGDVLAAPTVAQLATVLDRSSPAETAPEMPGLAQSVEVVPLAPVQRGMWFGQRMVPSSPHLLLANEIRISGRLSIPALVGALADLVLRHDQLRTRYPLIGRRPAQVAGDVADDLVRLVDLRQSGAGLDAELARLWDELTAHPMDVTVDGPLRVMLAELPDDDHLLMLVVHHLAADHWSLGILVRDLFELYRHRLDGSAEPLPPASISYADYAVWQHRQLAEGRYDSQRDYWRSVLQGRGKPLRWPVAKERPRVATRQGGRVRFSLSAALVAGVRECAETAATTPFVVYLAALNALVQQMTDAQDICVGTFAAHRPDPRLESVVGLFATALPLRIQADPRMSFGDLVELAKAAFVGAQSHLDLGADDLVRAAGIEHRDAARGTLYDVMLVAETAAEPDLIVPGLEITTRFVETPTATCDLSVILYPGDREPFGIVEYSTDVFEHSDAEQVARGLCALLAAAVRDTAAEIRDLPGWRSSTS